MLKKLLSRFVEPAQETEPERLVALAASALLLEVAWADHEISGRELALIEHQIGAQFGIGPEDVRELVAEARRDHEQSVDLYGYTRIINDHWDEPRKFELVRALWRLALADEQLHRYEEHTIRKIADLIHVGHRRFIEAKLGARAEVR